ncbi:MAG: hypothetical protein KF889_04465 [Alphaproteobacteria bacterium]|nr:hypothetical protein [Alphaproteobacteria bacterium]MCW5742120.1 hypothetical protein [Alphaproteobacteria bacterium]
MKRLLFAAALLAASAPVLAQTRTPAPTDRILATPFDGTWVGTAAASGSCAPLEIRLTIEGGAVDGTASEPERPRAAITGKKGEALPVPPALWQLHGRVQTDGALKLAGLRSMKERDRQNSTWNGRATANSISLAESGAGCSRAATLTRGR